MSCATCYTYIGIYQPISLTRGIILPRCTDLCRKCSLSPRLIAENFLSGSSCQLRRSLNFTNAFISSLFSLSCFFLPGTSALYGWRAVGGFIGVLERRIRKFSVLILFRGQIVGRQHTMLFETYVSRNKMWQMYLFSPFSLRAYKRVDFGVKYGFLVKVKENPAISYFTFFWERVNVTYFFLEYIYFWFNFDIIKSWCCHIQSLPLATKKLFFTHLQSLYIFEKKK